jgi:hypothetical protein
MESGGSREAGTTAAAARAQASALNRAEFAIAWHGVTELAPADDKRPLLVYIYPEAASPEEDPRFAVEEDRAFRDEKVVVGARFFRCVRIHQDQAQEDAALKRYARSAPCLVFVRPDLKPVSCQRGGFNAGRIFAAMCTTVKADHENCLRKTLKAQEQLEGELAKLYEMDGKIDAEKDAAQRQQLRQDRDALARELGAAEEALGARENALYELKPKVA